MTVIVCECVENKEGKEENTGYQHFSFPSRFLQGL